MNEHENDQPAASDRAAASVQPAVPTQAQLYDDLRRIGQLEDQKLAIQNEIDERTDRLREAIPQLDEDSLLYRILSATLKSAPENEQQTKKKRSPRRSAAKRTAKRKR